MIVRVGERVAICEDRSTPFAPSYCERAGTVVALLNDCEVRVRSDDRKISTTFEADGRRRAKGLLNVWFEQRAADPAWSPDARDALLLRRFAEMGQR